MIRKLCLSGIFLAMLFFAASFDINAQKPDKSGNKESPLKSTSTTKITITPVSKLENEIIEEMNFARTKPAEYAVILEGLRKNFNGTSYNAPGRKPFRTNEGAAALDEAVKVLKEVQPLVAVEINCAAVRASRDQLADLQKSGAFSHLGSDGSSPQERLKRYVKGNVQSSENLVGRSGTARDIVMMMLLDDGLSSRIHRKNLLDTRFKFGGVANGNNSKGMNLTVVVFSDVASEIEPCEMK